MIRAWSVQKHICLKTLPEHIQTEEIGLVFCMGRITVDGGISQFSLKEDAHPDHWDAKMGRATGKSREQVTLYLIMSQIFKKLQQRYNYFTTLYS